MWNWIQNLWLRTFGAYFDFWEFFSGFFFGLLAAYIYAKFEPIRSAIGDYFSKRAESSDRRQTQVSTDRYRLDVIQYAQMLHAARALFTLDEIAVEPRLLAPPAQPDPEKGDAVPEDTLSVAPNLPDWDYLSAVYQASTISLSDALRSDANLLITGHPGSGKTTALAYLAIRVALADPVVGELASLTPIFIHAADLVLDRASDKEPLKPIVQAVTHTLASNASGRLPANLRSTFRRKRALFLLDGVDEFTASEIPSIVRWLKRLTEEFPGNKTVVAGPVSGYDGLLQAGITPIPISPWSEYQQRVFQSRWAEAWQKHIAPMLPKQRLAEIDPALIGGWLSGTLRGFSPLDVTLMTWAAYVGDLHGSRRIDTYEAYVARFLSPNERKGAGIAALGWVNARSGIIPERAMRRGIPLNEMVEAGILTQHINNRFTFTQPNVGSYLAARAMAEGEATLNISEPGWGPADFALGYFAPIGDISPIANRLLESKADPLERGVLLLGRWLRDAPKKANWRADVLRRLATIATDPNRPYGLRLRVVHALSASMEETVSILFRRMLDSDKPSSRVLGALGLGGLRDEESVRPLIQTINTKRNLHTRQAACLALAAIGTEEALEGLGRIILESDEGVLIAAAEALACNPDEGWPMLRDAIEMKNLLTRRAAVFGLARIPEDWVDEILHRIQLEDDQWVVRGAAAEVIERRQNPPWKIQKPVEDVSELAWLQSFAQKEGMAVAPGRPALEMVRRALNKGSQEEKISALEAIVWVGGDELSLEIFQALGSGEAYLRDAAFEALWQLHASGTNILAQARKS
jgi:HEAT repeat protein